MLKMDKLLSRISLIELSRWSERLNDADKEANNAGYIILSPTNSEKNLQIGIIIESMSKQLESMSQGEQLESTSNLRG